MPTDSHADPYIESIMRGTDADLIPALIRFYWRGEGQPVILDCTYGKGRFWAKERPELLVTLDILPDLADYRASYESMPFDEDSFDVVVFDPPHIERNVEYEDTRQSVHAMYNLQPFTGDFKAGLQEIYRVAKKGAVLIAKMSDELSRPNSWPWHHVKLLTQAQEVGWEPFDLVIKERHLSIRNPAQERHRARRKHCFYLIFKKGAT